jgi:hypothetical protein
MFIQDVVFRLISTKFVFNFINHKTLIVLEVLLNMDFEFDDIVKHLFDLCVQLLPKRIGTEGKLLIPTILLAFVSRDNIIDLLDVGVHFTLFH